MPNRIMQAFTPNSAMSAAMSEMPVSIAMSTTMSDALTEYSIQRKTFRPACA